AEPALEAVAARASIRQKPCRRDGCQHRRQRERPGVVVKEAWLACGDGAHALQSDEAEEFYGRRSDGRHAEIVRCKADVARVGVRTTPGVEVERLNLLFQIVWIERHHADVENFSGGKLRGAQRMLHRTSDAEALHSSRPNFEVGRGFVPAFPPVEAETKWRGNLDGRSGRVL